MNNEARSLLLEDLVKNTDKISCIDDLLQVLQQAFVEVFFNKNLLDEQKQYSPSSSFQPSQPLSLDSNEETKVSLVRSVRVFHEKGTKSHPAFFQDEAYHPQAALFILEMLKSLSGNSKQWFKELQIESLSACLSVFKAIGTKNVRKCLPGIVSATVRYLDRSHLGKDSVLVQLKALHVLHSALMISFASKENEPWIVDTIGHLTNAMKPILDPKKLTKNGYSESTVYRLKVFFSDMMCCPGMEFGETSILAQDLVVAFVVVENLHHLQGACDRGEKGKWEDWETGPHSSRATFDDVVCRLRTRAAEQALSDALRQLGGVELLHVVTTVLRFSFLRPIIISESEDSVMVFKTLVRKLIRIVATEMMEDALYTSRQPRRYPSGVVDEALECLAHALAEVDVHNPDSCETPVTETHETSGEFLTNILLDECDAILQDWDLYMIHAPAIYVLTRAVLWQFKPIPDFLQDSFSPSHKDGERGHASYFPAPADFIEMGAFEQLWSVVAVPHLWNIAEDEELCNYQQVHHRQVVAATILRFLSLAASDVLEPSVLSGGVEGRRSFERFNTLALYLILEKASAGGIVQDAAVECIRQCMKASCEKDPMNYFLNVCLPLVDSASRAMKQPFLRSSVASVLRGIIEFVVEGSFGTGLKHSHRRMLLDQKATKTEDYHTDVDEGDFNMMTFMFHGRSSRLSLLMCQRLSVVEVRAVTQCCLFRDDYAISRVADFVRSAVDTAADGCRIAATDIDENGLKATLTLMRDCFDMATLLNMATEREAADDEFDRQTTSYNNNVKLLQLKVLDAIMLVISHCAQHTNVFTYVVGAVIRGLTSFLTTKQAESWRQAREEELAEARRKVMMETSKGKKEHHQFSGSAETEDYPPHESEEDENGEIAALKAPPLPWFDETASSNSEIPFMREGIECAIVLPRSHLKTVYRIYLCFFAKLKEPIALFVMTSSRSGKRSGEERRRMEAVPVSPALFAVFDGMEALLLLAVDFLCHRMVEEVLPLVLTWYERACLPRIPTNTDERVKEACKHFAETAMRESPISDLKKEVQKQCRPFFPISLPSAEVSAEDHNMTS
ncbi:unnamed protein product [Phytomonas sp. EM1]|nr:unnamed protein product [Phytomonas sp. EM1]|eukprot:CCW61904.1 unnamed protein product [Phytomonas sp. isolate EM1]